MSRAGWFAATWVATLSAWARPELAAERLHMNVDGLGMLDLEAGSVLSVDAYSVGVWGGYAYRPLVLSIGSQEQGALVRQRWAASLVGALSPWPNLSLGVALPLVLQQEVGARLADSEALGDVAGQGIGDLGLTGKWQLLSANGVNAAALLTLRVPSAYPKGQYLGESWGALQPRVAVDARIGRAQAGINFGMLLREPGAEFYGIALDHALIAQVGASLPVWRDLSLGTTASADTPLGEPFSGEATTVEWLGFASIDLFDAWAVVLGGGSGLAGGLTEPAARVFVSVRYHGGLPVPPPAPVAEDPAAAETKRLARLSEHEAYRLFELADKNGDAGLYCKSMHKYLATYDLAPRQELLFNAAVAADAANDVTRARDLYRRVVGELSGDDLDSAERQIAVLGARLAAGDMGTPCP